jgi:gliding motility-associated-like protein
VYFVGTTLSDDFIDLDTANFTTRKGVEDAFLGRISNDSGKVIWSNYYGGLDSDFGVELDVEMDHDVFLLGTTLSDSAIATADVHQNSIGGMKDVFIAKFSEFGEHKWGTYYGGLLDEEAYSIDVYGNTNIYVTGSTFSDSSISNPNSFMFQQQDSLSGIENGFLAQFKQNISTMAGGFGGGGSSTNLIYCLGDTVQVYVEGGALGTDAVWAWYANSCGETGPALGFGDTLTFVATSNFDIFLRIETVTNASDCMTAGVTIVSKPVAEITSMSHMCMENEYLFSSTVIEGQQALWTGPNGYSSSLLEPTLMITDNAFSGVYELKITDINGCWDTASIDLSVFNQPVMTMTSSNITCFGDNDGSVLLSASGDGPFEYVFNVDTSLVFDYQNLYCDTFYYAVIDTFGCVASDSVLLTQPNKIIANVLIDPSICFPGQAAASIVIDTAYLVHSTLWLPSNTVSDSLVDLSTGNEMVYVSVPNGCSDSASIVIPEQYILTSDITLIEREKCRGAGDGQAMVSATNGVQPFNYLWSDDGVTDSLNIAFSPGLHYVSVVDDNGCVALDSVTILIGDTLIWSELITQSDCGLNNGGINITILEGNNPFVFNWSDGTSSEDLLNAADGGYSVQIIDSNGCTYSRNYELVYLNNLQVTATSSAPVIGLGSQISLFSVSNLPANEVSVVWSPSTYLLCDTCVNTIGTPVDSTSYIVTYVHESGCFGSDTVVVLIKRPCGNVFVPTAFSPNGDGLNDEWCILGGCIKSFQLAVYNQWGEVVFISSDRDDCWKGTYQGELVQNDVYVFHLEYTLIDGQFVSQNGSVGVNH